MSNGPIAPDIDIYKTLDNMQRPCYILIAVILLAACATNKQTVKETVRQNDTIYLQSTTKQITKDTTIYNIRYDTANLQPVTIEKITKQYIEKTIKDTTTQQNYTDRQLQAKGKINATATRETIKNDIIIVVAMALIYLCIIATVYILILFRRRGN